jgi:TRAP-type C4-dicarboxylate transport system substrate-binding protein
MVLRDCARAATAEQRRVNRQQAEKSLANLKEKGMLINPVSDAELARMRDATHPVHDGQWPTIGADVKTALTADLQKARAR